MRKHYVFKPKINIFLICPTFPTFRENYFAVGLADGWLASGWLAGRCPSGWLAAWLAGGCLTGWLAGRIP